MNQSMQSIYGVRKPEGSDQGAVPRSLLTSSNRGVIYQQRGIGRQISSWLLEPVKLQGGSTSSSSYAVDIKKSLPKLGDQQKHQGKGGRSSIPKAGGGPSLPSISGKLNPYRTSDINLLKKQANGAVKGSQRQDNWQQGGGSPGKRKTKAKKTRASPKKTRLQSKVDIYSTNAVRPSRPKPAKPGSGKPQRKQRGQTLPGTFHSTNLATRAKMLTVFLRQAGQNVDLLEDTLQFVSQETKHKMLLRHAEILTKHQYYFSSIRIAHHQQESLGVVLQALMVRITNGMEGGEDPRQQKWKWNLVDHELFVRQFGDLKIVQQYRGVRKKLLGMGEGGAVALARVEMEILLKVVSDFMEQLSLPSYPKAVVSELMREETGGAPDQVELGAGQQEDEQHEEEGGAAQGDDLATEASMREAEEAAAVAEESPAPAAEKSWQEIEKERLEAEMKAVVDEMDDEKSEPDPEKEAEPTAAPAEEETPPAEPAASTPTPSRLKAPAPPGPEEPAAPTPQKEAEVAEPTAEEEEEESAPTPTPPPAPTEPEAPAPPAEEPAEEPVLSERELLEKEREAMQKELEELEKSAGDEADAGQGEDAIAATPSPPPPPAAEDPEGGEEAKAKAEREAQEAEAKAKAEREELEALKRKQEEEAAAAAAKAAKEEAEAKAKAEAEEKRKREEEEAAAKAKEAEEKAAKEAEAKAKAEREELEALKRKQEEEAAAAAAKAAKEEAEAKAKAEAEEKRKREEEEAAAKAKEAEEKAAKEAEAKAAKEAKEAEEKAAVKIQSRARGMLAKKQVSMKREAAKEEKAAVKIQSRARGMLAKKQVSMKREAKLAELQKESEEKPQPAPEPETKPEPPKEEPVAEADDIEKLRQQALDEQRRIAEEEGVDFESTLTKPVEEEEPEPVAPAVGVPAPAALSEPPLAKEPVPKVEPKPVETTFEDVVAREEKKREKAEQDIDQAIKKMREEMKQEKERLRKEMEEKRRKLQEARQRKRESATWKKTPITIVPTESPLKIEKEAVKLSQETIPETKEPEPDMLRDPRSSAQNVIQPVSVMKPEPVREPVPQPQSQPNPRESEGPPKASFEKEIHQALQHVQEQLAMQQQQFLQMQFTNMQMTPGMTPGGANLMRGGMPMNPMMSPLNEKVMATPGMQPMGQVANNNPPTQEEINEYAVYLGMDPVSDKELLYIAEWALSAPLPEGWTEHVDTSGNEFYFNSMTGVSTYEHPLDGQFREYYRQMKMQAAAK